MYITCNTDAPYSARVRPELGPAIAWVTHKTLRPSSGLFGLDENDLGGEDATLLTGTMGRVDICFPCSDVLHASSDCTMAIGRPTSSAACSRSVIRQPKFGNEAFLI